MSESSARNAAIRYELVAEAVQDPGTTDPIVVVRKALRGRLHRAILMAVLFGIAGAVLGFVLVPPLYESTGLVRIAASLPAVLYEETNAQFNEPFEAFAESQVTRLSSREVLQNAVEKPQLQEVGWPIGITGVQQLEKAVSVSRERGHQFINVSVQHDQPEVAQAVVNAVLMAYAELAGTDHSLSPDDVEQLLIARERELEQQIQSLRERMLEVSDQYGLAAVQRLHSEKVEQLTTIDQKLTEINRAVNAVSASMNEPHAMQAETVQGLLTAFADNVRDSTAALVQREQTLAAEIESWKQRYGPNHPMLREFNRQLEVIRLRLQMQRGPAAIASSPNSASIDATQTMLNHLLNLEQTYRAMRDTVRREAAELGTRHAALAGIDEHLSEVQQRLSDTRRRVDEIEVENSRPKSSRVAIASMGDFPLSPVKDRRQGLAAAAGLFGVIIGAGLVVIVGVTDPRCRYADQLVQAASGIPVLCRLPDLTDAGDDECARATIAVHQLRHALQISHEQHHSRVITITSCGPGEGRTSLALALAGSFAGSGSRTLLIDADPRNRDLSEELGLEQMAGLVDAVRGGQSSGEIVRTDVDNLWVLPAGSIAAERTAQLSQQNFKWLLDAISERFDAVIVDTGPVTTSVESCASCAVADAVVLMASRGQSLGLIREAVTRAQQCTAGRIGIVYNRADGIDVKLADQAVEKRQRDITALVPGAIPQRGTTAGSIGRSQQPAHVEVPLERAA